ncbi:MAG: ribokinase [Clostridia bacterium]|nr:ribokinase [Clostridia bacterium]
MRRIIVIGSVNTDLTIETEKFPKEGETVPGSGFFVAQGGKGANQAVAAARLGGQVVFCGCVGNDSFGKSALLSLEQEKIDVRHVRSVDAPTGTAVILISNGNNRIIVDAGANARLTESDIDSVLADASSGDILLTQLENPIPVIGYGLKRAKEKGLFVILNPAPANKSILPYLDFCDLIAPNETEAEILGGRDFLLQKVPVVLTTLGEKGFEIATKNSVKTYPCIKVLPVDTTAAGDTLCGGLAAKLAEGATVEQAALFGSKAASVACTKKGAQPSIPTFEELISY